MDHPIDLFGKCPYVTSQRLLAGKWTILILYTLSGGVMRFGELQRRLPGITQATLTKELRALESYRLLNRHVYPEVPPKVEYSLTEVGRKFLPVLDRMKEWGEAYIAFLKSDIPSGTKNDG